MIAIDDFGVGHSSLSRLARLPIDALKIDRSLVADLGQERTREVVAGIVQLVHALKMPTIAGVEDEATRVQLAEMGCDAVRGFHANSAAAARGAGSLARSAWDGPDRRGDHRGRSVRRRGDPDRSLADRDRLRLLADLDRRADLGAGGRVDAQNRAVGARDPDVAQTGRHVNGWPVGTGSPAVLPLEGSIRVRLPSVPSAHAADSPTVTLNAFRTPAASPDSSPSSGRRGPPRFPRTTWPALAGGVAAPLPASAVGEPSASPLEGSSGSTAFWDIAQTPPSPAAIWNGKPRTLAGSPGPAIVTLWTAPRSGSASHAAPRRR